MNSTHYLEIDGIQVSYGNVQVLCDLFLHVNRGEMVAVVGPNGSGKTTLLRTIQGLLHPTAGEIRLAGWRVDRLPPCDLVRAGVTLIPEARHLFLDMTVRENLELGAFTHAQSELPGLLEAAYGLFPVLWEKQAEPASRLSAGQQQMLAIARALMARPRLLLLDDPFVGLAPGVIDRFCETLAGINHGGVTVLIAGQHVRRLLRLCDRGYLLEGGRVVLEGWGTTLLESPHLRRVLLTGSAERS